MRWLEDPLPQCDLDTYGALAMSIPLALGERLLVHADAAAMLRLKLQAFTLDVVACGGLTRAVDLVTAAQMLGVPVYPHGRSFVPAVHLAAAYPDAIAAVEYRLQWEPARQQRYAQPWLPAHGVITVPRSPGLGARRGSADARNHSAPAHHRDRRSRLERHVARAVRTTRRTRHLPDRPAPTPRRSAGTGADLELRRHHRPAPARPIARTSRRIVGRHPAPTARLAHPVDTRRPGDRSPCRTP
ncbi:hypothetical protein HCB39_26710 [Salinispora arenicola]|nr:hypothetical protein [Salinispora arenicola]